MVFRKILIGIQKNLESVFRKILGIQKNLCGIQKNFESVFRKILGIQKNFESVFRKILGKQKNFSTGIQKNKNGNQKNLGYFAVLRNTDFAEYSKPYTFFIP